MAKTFKTWNPPAPVGPKRILCGDCPGWWERKRDDGTDTTVAVLDREGKPISIDGVQQLKRHENGRFVTKGWCLPNGPHVIAYGGGLLTMFDETCSDWTCETQAKRDYIASLKK